MCAPNVQVSLTSFCSTYVVIISHELHVFIIAFDIVVVQVVAAQLILKKKMIENACLNPFISILKHCAFGLSGNIFVCAHFISRVRSGVSHGVIWAPKFPFVPKFLLAFSLPYFGQCLS